MKSTGGGITPPLGRNDLRWQHMLESSSAKKDVEVLVGTRLTMSHQCALVTKPTSTWGHPGEGRRSCPSAQPW